MNVCQMLVDWKADENGEPGDEIDCGAPAAWKSGGTLLCHEHAAAALAHEDLTPSEVTPLVPNYKGISPHWVLCQLAGNHPKAYDAMKEALVAQGYDV